MPSVYSVSRPSDWPSSTVMTPSLPTLSMTSAMILPTSGSAALIDATAAIWARSSTGRDWLLQLRDDRLDALLDAALEAHRVGPGADVLEALGDHRLAEDDGGRRAVAGDVVGLGGDLLEELRAHVLEWILELDLLGDRHPVVGDRRRAVLLVEDDVATLRSEGDADRVGQAIDAALEAPTGHLVEEELLGHGVCFLSGLGIAAGVGVGQEGVKAWLEVSLVMTARMSLWLMIIRSSPPILNSVPAYFA